MKRFFLAGVIVLFAAPLFADSTWVLETSTLAYHADHPFHNTVGKTSASRGKGVCTPIGCDFLVAVPVNTFDSGDGNRDAHMLQAVNGGAHPMVSVRAHLNGEPTVNGFKADLTVNFGGKEVVYPGVAFAVGESTADRFTAKGDIPLILSKHDVKRPSLMGITIKDSAPVTVETTWKK